MVRSTFTDLSSAQNTPHCSVCLNCMLVSIYLYCLSCPETVLSVCVYSYRLMAYNCSEKQIVFLRLPHNYLQVQHTRKIFQTVFSLCSSTSASSTKPCQVQCGNDKHPLYPSSEVPAALSHNEAPTF